MNLINHRSRNPYWIIALSLTALLLAGCSSNPKATYSSSSSVNLSSFIPSSNSGRGGYYQNDGPHRQVPTGLASTPDAIPKIEPYRKSNSRPYRVLGKTYAPITDNRPFTQQGIGSWYGKQFHGKKTASGEHYDMYKMTAAHPTLPIPSYARVTNLSNGKQVIVRINDRGPFHSGRIIDLSYTAALKLGYIQKGRESVQVERLLPRDIRQMKQARLRPKKHYAQSNTSQLQQHRQNQAAQRKVNSHSQWRKEASASIGNSPSGFHLQLGAFSQKHYAETMRTQYASTWSGKLPAAKVIRKNSLYRLYAGPFTNRAQAADAARQIQISGMAKPLIVQR